MWKVEACQMKSYQDFESNIKTYQFLHCIIEPFFENLYGKLILLIIILFREILTFVAEIILNIISAIYFKRFLNFNKSSFVLQ